MCCLICGDMLDYLTLCKCSHLVFEAYRQSYSLNMESSTISSWRKLRPLIPENGTGIQQITPFEEEKEFNALHLVNVRQLVVLLLRL